MNKYIHKRDTIMRLLALSEWRLRRFEEPRPCQKTCNNWCNNGDIPAVRRGYLWFIDLDEEEKMTGNDLADAVL